MGAQQAARPLAGAAGAWAAPWAEPGPERPARAASEAGGGDLWVTLACVLIVACAQLARAEQPVAAPDHVTPAVGAAGAAPPRPHPEGRAAQGAVRRLDFTGTSTDTTIGDTAPAEGGTMSGGARPFAAEPAPNRVSSWPLATLLALALVSLASGAMHWIAAHFRAVRPHSARSAARPPAAPVADIEQICRETFEQSAAAWRFAESAVLEIKADSPLRTLLMNELGQVGGRLSLRLEAGAEAPRSLDVANRAQHLRLVHARLKRALRDIERIHATAKAALATAGSALTDKPVMPRTRQEALHVLGASGDVDEQSLKRLVKALRQCWHPDLAADDVHRAYRGLKLTQINVANDILTGRRSEG